MKISEIKTSLKKNKMVFFTYKKITDQDYRTNLVDYYVHKSFKPRKVITSELAAIREYWKCDPMLYYRYRLFEKPLSLEELLDYIPPYYFYCFYMPSIYSSSGNVIADSKINMNDFFGSRGIPTPAKIAVLKNGVISGREGERISFEELEKRLAGAGSDMFFMKPDGGRGGKGIIRIERIGKFLFMNNEFLDRGIFEEVTGRKTFIIQEAVRQRNDFRRMYPGSVNTLRVITQLKNNEVTIPAAVLRMGRNGSYVDNSSAGGVFACVDTHTGSISRTGYLLHSNLKFDRHPDTGFSFGGFVISEWPEIKEEIKRMALKTPEFPDVAWDIAVLEDGITAIEINLNYGLDQLQTCIGGMRRRLNISPEAEYMMTGNRKYILR